jgi:hypothetical protein
MARASRCAKAFVSFAVLCAGTLLAPPAGADPTAGAESADSVITHLRDQGYNVQINWVSGVSSEPLLLCKVTAIHNPDRSSPPAPKSSTTVYVDVSCPNQPDDGVWGGVGIGFG